MQQVRKYKKFGRHKKFLKYKKFLRYKKFFAIKTRDRGKKGSDRQWELKKCRSDSASDAEK